MNDFADPCKHQPLHFSARQDAVICLECFKKWVAELDADAYCLRNHYPVAPCTLPHYYPAPYIPGGPYGPTPITCTGDTASDRAVGL